MEKTHCVLNLMFVCRMMLWNVFKHPHLLNEISSSKEGWVHRESFIDERESWNQRFLFIFRFLSKIGFSIDLQRKGSLSLFSLMTWQVLGERGCVHNNSLPSSNDQWIEIVTKPWSRGGRRWLQFLPPVRPSQLTDQPNLSTDHSPTQRERKDIWCTSLNT